MSDFRQTCPEYIYKLSDKSTDDILSEISSNGYSQTAYSKYGKNLRKAVDIVYSDNPDNPLAYQLCANVERFAAYKTYSLAEKCKTKSGGDVDKMKTYISAYDRFQSAEYNTARARARTAKQWNEWQEDNNVLPNIKWLPSRSVVRREEHELFYNRVWAKDDPFWSKNQPGCLWNCKCDWQETDEPVTDGNPSKKQIYHAGLENNPGETGIIFTDNAPYFKDTPDNAENQCRMISYTAIPSIATEKYKEGPFICNIGGNNLMLDMSRKKINSHFAKSNNDQDFFWIKNQLLFYPELLQHAEYIGYKESDTTHNTNRSTVTLKKKTDYYYYYRMTIGGKTFYLHFGHYTDTGNVYMYATSMGIPDGIKTL